MIETNKPRFLTTLEGFAAPEPEPVESETEDPGKPTGARMSDRERAEAGQRFTKARELNGMSQCHAAELLGYRNSAPLSKIEAGIAPPPPWLYKRASMIYGVSCDYLHGVSTFPERDPRTAALLSATASARVQIERHSHKIVEALIADSERALCIRRLLDEMAGLVEEAAEAVGAMRTARFDETCRGGSRLVAAVERLQAASQSARQRYARRDTVAAINAVADAGRVEFEMQPCDVGEEGVGV